ncbi:MAG: hypothetical protein WKF75_07810 [Singulisphaera sp.]
MKDKSTSAQQRRQAETGCEQGHRHGQGRQQAAWGFSSARAARGWNQPGYSGRTLTMTGGALGAGGGPGSLGDGFGVDLTRGRMSDWSASAASAALWNLSWGLWARSLSSTWTRPGGMSGRISVIGAGRPPIRLLRRSRGESPGYGSRPVIR